MSNDKRGKYHSLYEGLTLGFVFPVAIGLGYVLGRWLDRIFNTSPWLAGTFTLLGIAAAFVQLFRTGRTNDGSADRKQ